MSAYEFVNKTEIKKGWSGDKKFCATDTYGNKYLYRISDLSQYETKRQEFEMMQKVASLGIPMCKPLEFGTCDEGVYSVQSWIDGKDAEEAISSMRPAEQYAYGFEAGKILKAIHTIPAPENVTEWQTRFNNKIDRKIKGYTDCPLKYENGQLFLDYIEQNRHLLQSRPQVYQHGDYHIGNMMIDTDGKLQIIDFNRNDYGDPWEEFNRIVWCAQVSPLFATGMVDGYFDNNVPMAFWRLLALYIASNTLSSLYWAIPFGEKEIRTMRRQAAEVLVWYDNMQNPVPNWYQWDVCLQSLDGIPFLMKRPFDFGFLSEYGDVFCIFDGQDSGNICFGTEKDGTRYFVKFAGAPTARYQGTAKDAVERLKATVPIYQALAHPNLIKYIESKQIADGFAVVFLWAEGDCMGRMYPESHQRFMQLDVKDRLQAFDDILSFFVYLAEQKYVAIDFYDASILYDFASKKTTVCDIDFFRRQPTFNDMGRMWGSSRFQSPEEYELGAVLDEITNVYTLGATAFALFGGYNRTPDAWQLSDKRFSVAQKATSADRTQRQQSIKQFVDEWQKADCPD